MPQAILPIVGGRTIRLSELLLGIEGMALLRGLIDGGDTDMVARLDEIKRIVASLDDEPYSLSLDVAEHDARAGYAMWAEVYDVGRNPLIEVEQPSVEAIVAAFPAGRALDAACGTGRHARHLSVRHDVVGVDGSQHMLAKARASVPDARFVRGDLTAMPLGDGVVDLAVCSLALTHVETLTPAVGELARVTRRGGRLVLSDIHPFSVATLGQAFFPTPDGGLAFVRNHLHHLASYLDAFRHAGLRVRGCDEPKGGGDQLPRLAMRFIPEAAKQALEGLPLAIVWDLEVE
jgi:SAM-dependent methyltransferase